MEKILNLSLNEQEILKELLDEEIEDLDNSEVSTINDERYNFLKQIRKKLNDEALPLEIRLGFEIGKLSKFAFEDIYNAITKKENLTLYCDELFNLYDKFGYKEVNAVIFSLGKEKFKEAKENE